VAISSASQPDFYMGILEGSLRIMPAWETNFLGHTISWSVLIPAALPLGIIFTGAALWPFFEQWATGDKSFHNINDRPRNAPIRTATGMAAVVFYGVLWAEGANDVLADRFQVPLYTITWIARVLVFVGPAIAFWATRRICIGLQRKDAGELAHGYESGIIRQLPSGEFIEVHKSVSAEKAAVLGANKGYEILPGPEAADVNGVPAPSGRGVLGLARAKANRGFAETVAPENGHGPNGHNGHGDGHEQLEAGGHEQLQAGGHAAVGADSRQGELPPGDEH
jgi:ubiquinol-cytochrome c reductase cytochrome b subunit